MQQQLDSILAELRPLLTGGPGEDLGSSIKQSAAELGINPVDLGAAISYETKGTFDPWIKGPTTRYGTHRGLIQWGEPQAQSYGVSKDTPVSGQMQAVTKYLRDAGVRPGMGLLDIYSAINAGHVGKYGASDRPGMTVASHVAKMQPHIANAQALLNDTGGVSSRAPNVTEQSKSPAPFMAPPPQSPVGAPPATVSPWSAKSQQAGDLDSILSEVSSLIPQAASSLTAPLPPLRQFQIPTGQITASLPRMI